jgi:cystinosin
MAPPRPDDEAAAAAAAAGPEPGPFVEHPRDDSSNDDDDGGAPTTTNAAASPSLLLKSGGGPPRALRPWLIVAASLAAGALLGLLLPADARHLPDPRFARASNCLGWAAFASWTVSFWPQILQNRRRASADGLSRDFVALNVLGFACYSAFSGLLYWNAAVGDEFRRRTGGASPRGAAVQLNDVAFAFHALFAASLTALQCAWYSPAWPSAAAAALAPAAAPAAAKRSLAPATRLALLAALVVAGAHALAARAAWDAAEAVAERARRACGGGGGGESGGGGGDDPFSPFAPAPWTLLDVAYTLSYVKMAVTLTKYVPQAAFNFKRRSTVGWSVTNILLDASGGLASLAQQLLGAWWWRDLRSVVAANPVRFALSVASLSFDLLFVLQHYVLFRHSWRAMEAAARDKRRGRRREEEEELEQEEADAEERQQLRAAGGGEAA